MSRAAENHAKANTLSCVIGLCIGKVTTIELRNESHVTGRIVEVSVWKRLSHWFEIKIRGWGCQNGDNSK